MHSTVYATATEFLSEVGAWLEQKEAANSLILGLAGGLVGAPLSYSDHPPIFAAVYDQDGPALAALFTPPHNVIVATDREDMGAVVELLARDLIARDLPVPGVLGPTRPASAFADAWSRLTGTQSREGIRQRIYELREVTPPRLAPGQMRRADARDADRIVAWSDAFQLEAAPTHPPTPPELTVRRVAEGNFYLWEDAEPVSMAARARPTRHGVTVSAVYTPPELRRRGYASACVAALSEALLAEGFDYCTLFTDLDNPTSNAIYQQIGYRPICDFREVVFAPKDITQPSS